MGPVCAVDSWILSTVSYGKSAFSASTRPAVRPPVLETNSQWSELETTVMKNGGSWS
jgi:hypothetical protein